MEGTHNVFQSTYKYLSGFQFSRLEITIYGIILLLVMLWCNIKWNLRRFEKAEAKINNRIPSYPIIGMGHQYLGTPEQIISNVIKLIETYGPEPYSGWLGSRFGITVIKPEDVQIVLNNSKSLKKDEFYKFFKNTLGDGLLTAPVEKWRKNRRVIAPKFNSNLLAQSFPVFNQKTQILIKNLKKEIGKSKSFDLWNYIVPTTLNTICQTAMGYDLDTQSHSGTEFVEALTKASELDAMRIYKPWLYPDVIFSIYRRLRGLHQVYNDLHKLPKQIIKEMKEKYAQIKLENKSNAIHVNDDGREQIKVFLDTLLEVSEAGANFSDDELRDEVLTLMIAASDTSATTNCFCLLMLAMHPDIQDKVYDEIHEVIGDGDHLITIEDTYKLVYLEQVIKETLRLYPPVPVILRQLQDDISLNEITLPKGTTMIVTPMGTHRLSELYPNPYSFNPENFSSENVNKRHKCSFIAFSGGPRGCLGNKYAMLLMKVLLSTFLRNFSVHTDMKFCDIKLKLDMLLRSSTGYPVNIRTRDRRPTYNRNV